ncbi:MAG: DUF4097 family beta strand repeat-containing protein [Roseiflexaceae bacterium]|jgi:hypothetical protein|nr:DUF4097 family beta strand repeat-containing protein [Chloroflexaceae bacterium]MCE2853025.1 DUF4097 family beta strand repeat-containing protein [Chloroflexaceae bacterium]
MNLFRIRIKWIVVTALLSIFVGVVGIALSITPEFVRFITSLDLRNLVPDKSDATYMLYDEIDVQPSANVQILATGGNVSISESPTNQIKVFFHVPYKPNDRLIPLIAQNGATYVIDERAIWQELAGNTSQPNITLDVQVPHGTSLTITNTFGEINLGGILHNVVVSSTLGTITVNSAQIDQLDLTSTVSSSIKGLAPKSTNISLNRGSVALHVVQAGQHDVYVKDGSIAMKVDQTMTIATVHRANNGTFHSEVVNTKTNPADVSLSLIIDNGNIEVTPP